MRVRVPRWAPTKFLSHSSVVERRLDTAEVGSSSLPGTTRDIPYLEGLSGFRHGALVERLRRWPVTPEITGSIPVCFANTTFQACPGGEWSPSSAGKSAWLRTRRSGVRLPRRPPTRQRPLRSSPGPPTARRAAGHAERTWGRGGHSVFAACPRGTRNRRCELLSGSCLASVGVAIRKEKTGLWRSSTTEGPGKPYPSGASRPDGPIV